MSNSQTVNVYFRKDKNDPTPGSWTFTPNPVVVPYHDENDDHQSLHITYALSGSSGWDYVSVSIHLLASDGSPSDTPFTTLTRTSRQNQYAPFSLPDGGAFQLALLTLDDNTIALSLKNNNNGRQNAYLGLALTVRNGPYTQTSQDPQIELPRKTE